MADGTKYNVVLDPSLNSDLSDIAIQLNISKDEAVRRALELFKHAAKADSVQLIQGGQKQAVKVK